MAREAALRIIENALGMSTPESSGEDASIREEEDAFVAFQKEKDEETLLGSESPTSSDAMSTELEPVIEVSMHHTPVRSRRELIQTTNCYQDDQDAFLQHVVEKVERGRYTIQRSDSYEEFKVSHSSPFQSSFPASPAAVPNHTNCNGQNSTTLPLNPGLQQGSPFSSNPFPSEMPPTPFRCPSVFLLATTNPTPLRHAFRTI